MDGLLNHTMSNFIPDTRSTK